MPLPDPTPALPRADLTATRRAIAQGRTSARAELDLSLSLARADSHRHVWLAGGPDEAGARQALDSLTPQHPMAGLAVTIKDLFDLAGQPTPAGSRVLMNAAPARADAPAVQRLRRAGAVVLGRTNMTEFAFSGIGHNPHHGTPVNPADAAVARIPGGSSSGAGVTVAAWSAFVGLGSDTGGSIRIPAALCGCVGFKPTARRVPTEGALPLSTTLDTVCAMTRSVRDARIAYEVLADLGSAPARADLSQWRLALVRHTVLDGLDATVALAFERTLSRLRAAGASIETLDLPQVGELAQLQATGGFSAAEAYAWHHALLADQRAGYDPRVALRIDRGTGMAAWQYLALHRERQAWIGRMSAALAGFDAVLSPTVPLVAPPIADIASDDEAFFRINALMLRNTSVVNMLDGCALSLPMQDRGELPTGLMVWAPALRDDTVLAVSADIERALATHADSACAAQAHANAQLDPEGAQ